jgi:citrate synthase
MTAAASGLEGVVVAETRLSHVDGKLGELVIAGHRLQRLAERATFADALALLVAGELPDIGQRQRIESWLLEGRILAHERRSATQGYPSAMDALRASVATLTETELGAEPLAQAARLAGAFAGFVASWARGPSLPAPERVPHAEDLLRRLNGRAVSSAEAAALNTYWVTVIDHGMNASTFTARVIASTGSDLVSAVTGAIGALKGPLHGGAPGPVLDMLDAVGSAERAPAYVAAELAAGRRIMGLGHRVYRVRDPRAEVLEGAVQKLGGSAVGRLALARAVEKEAERQLADRHPDRALRANVEFYTALLLEALGIDRALFSAIFACSRVGGWCAHVAEQRAFPRLIRPAARYVGPAPQD